jgi:hypothetical protein
MTRWLQKASYLRLQYNKAAARQRIVSQCFKDYVSSRWIWTAFEQAREWISSKSNIIHSGPGLFHYLLLVSD